MRCVCFAYERQTKADFPRKYKNATADNETTTTAAVEIINGTVSLAGSNGCLLSPNAER